MYLKGDGRFAETLLVEPAVGVKLTDDLRVGGLRDATGEFAVADRVAIACAEQEVRHAHDLVLASAQGGGRGKRRLIDDRDAVGHRGVGPEDPFLDCAGAPRGKVKPGIWAANKAMREGSRR